MSGLEMDEVVAQVGGREFTRRELMDAFSAVEEPGDWKAPIDQVVPEDFDLDAIAAAVEFFTATEATFTDAGGRRVRVEADGYRMGPAGP